MTDETIEIPEGALVACPLHKFALVRVGQSCPGCPHFAGLADRFPGSPHAFATRYTVRCKAEPQQRQISQLVEVDK